jgi:hypothetical protein
MWDAILVQYGTMEITQKQVYAYWQHVNEDSWRLDDNQVKSAQAILAAEHGVTIKIPVKHQLCYWHGVRYIKEWLAEDKPPVYYDPRKAHAVFSFIDATWAPGTTRGNNEEYFDGCDVEAGANIDGGVWEYLQQMQDVSRHIRAAMCTGPDYLHRPKLQLHYHHW